MSGLARVLVLCPDRAKPTGGMKTLYRHVDILNANGLDAFVVHARKGFHCTWFENRTRVTSIPEITLREDDVLVVPDAFDHAFQPTTHKSRRSRLRELWKGSEMPWAACHGLIQSASRIVMLCLNPYNTFRLSSAATLSAVVPYRHPRVVAALTISRDCERYLRHAFPDLPIVNYPKAIASEAFVPSEEKRDQVCFMPRKKPKDAIQVLSFLRLRGALDGFGVVPIDGMSEAEVARVMGESKVFLSFSHDEGLPRPPMEAMLAGCVVVGYHGQGGAEYMTPELCLPVTEGDVIGFAETTEQVLRGLRRDPGAFDELVGRARQYVLDRYSTRLEEEAVVGFWERLRDGRPLEVA